MQRHPVAYLRRSKVDASNPGDISRDVQLEAVRKLAAGEDGELVVLEDWGKSGRRSKLHLRTEYARLLSMIAADSVSTLYSYNLSRLGRSARDLLDLAELCAQHGTRIRLEDGPEVDARSATGQMMLTILAAVDTWQAEVQSERTSAGLVAYRERNVRQGKDPNAGLGRANYGEKPGEDAQAVMRAFTDAGSYLGAAKLLTQREVPTSIVGSRWHPKTVSRIVSRLDPRIVPKGGRPGAAARGSYRFSGILVCHCGATLTSRTVQGRVSYLCPVGNVNPKHSRPYQVSERKVIEWATREVTERSNLWEIIQAHTDDPAADGRLAAIAQERVAAAEAWSVAHGTLPRSWLEGKLAALDAETEALETASRVKTMFLPVVEWAGDPATVNAGFRNLWTSIRLGKDMRPVLAEWRPGALGLP